MSSVRHFVLPDLGEGLMEADIAAWATRPRAMRWR